MIECSGASSSRWQELSVAGFALPPRTCLGYNARHLSWRPPRGHAFSVPDNSNRGEALRASVFAFNVACLQGADPDDRDPPG